MPANVKVRLLGPVPAQAQAAVQLSVSGAIDGPAAMEIRDAVHAWARHAAVLLDLGAVASVDDAGLGVLLEAIRSAPRGALRLRGAGASRPVLLLSPLTQAAHARGGPPQA